MKKAAILVCALALAAAFASCGKKVPLADDQKVFAGKWTAGNDFVTVTADGGGDLKVGGTTITGGKTAIAGDMLTVSMGPIKKEMKVTKKPAEDGGTWSMELDGVVYTKQ